ATVARGLDVEAVPFEVACHQSCQGRLVVHDEHARQGIHRNHASILPNGASRPGEVAGWTLGAGDGRVLRELSVDVAVVVARHRHHSHRPGVVVGYLVMSMSAARSSSGQVCSSWRVEKYTPKRSWSRSVAW